MLQCASSQSAGENTEAGDSNAVEVVQREVDETRTEAENAVDTAVSTMGCVEGDCENGSGVYIYTDGSKYAGEFKDGLREGQGVMTYVNGDIYKGKYKAGKRSGYALYVFANGDKYDGEFVDGEMQGLGNYYWKDGSVLKGDFEEDGGQGGGTFLKDGTDLRHKGKDCKIDSRVVKCHN